MVEHSTENAGVGSSILPLGKFNKRKWLSGRASPCQGEGREFESRLPLHTLYEGKPRISIDPGNYFCAITNLGTFYSPNTK